LSTPGAAPGRSDDENLTGDAMTHEELFWTLYRAGCEKDVDAVLAAHTGIFAAENWRPYGGNDNNFGVVENQQASPIPALVEKVINAVDAILMRRCLEEGIDPRSQEAPQSIEEAVQRFFPDAEHWDLGHVLRAQAEQIQILADGPRGDTSVIIYDEGEGQHPEDFSDTFLSLLRGNKNEVHFVQGKYNMGGAGAIVFCGKHRYQLIASKRFDGTGRFGFTLLRRHPLQGAERVTKRATWYEYLTVGGETPAFDAGELDLSLHHRMFRTGTVIKLYSYDFPSGINDLSRDLSQSLNEYLFSPALPLYIVERKSRYPNQQRLERPILGLKYRLEESGSRKYIEDPFSIEYDDASLGTIKITCYVFKPHVDDLSAAETKRVIQREFFKNNMSVLFSLNGQVHGSYTSEFITRSLKFPLLKDWLLIHVDCTDLNMEVRNELFMASRDRLKEGEDSRRLRRILADVLREGPLKEVHKARKDAITIDSSKDTKDLLRSLTRDLPLKGELADLLNQAFRISRDEPGNAPGAKEQPRKTPGGPKPQSPPFLPQRFPSYFRLDGSASGSDGLPLVKVPLGGHRTVRFLTDVEDTYFDRSHEPGSLQIAVLVNGPNQGTGGAAPGLPNQPSALLNVVKTSPQRGTIRVSLKPTREVKVGDAVKIQAQLSGAGEDFEQIFWVRITDPEKPGKPEPVEEKAPELGLPELLRVSQTGEGADLSWEALDVQANLTMDHQTVVIPFADEEKLQKVFINMDSKAFLNHRAKLSSEENLKLAERRYVLSVYFHALFLYVITKNRGFTIARAANGQGEVPVDLPEYVGELFQNHFTEFLLSFGAGDLIASLEA
jgi:hypothetical protein